MMRFDGCAILMAIQNPFIGLPLDSLTSLRTKYLAALGAIAINQTYTLNGKSLSRANLSDVRDTVGMLNAAIDDANGDTSSAVVVGFSS